MPEPVEPVQTPTMLARLLALFTVLALTCASTPAHAIASAPGAVLALESGASPKTAHPDFFALGVKANKEKSPLSAERTKEKTLADAESSNYRRNYLRARYMDPGQGRFLGMDGWTGRESSPNTLHKYLWTESDPANGIDPSGRLTLRETMLAVTTLAVVSVAAVDIYVRYFARGGDDVSIDFSGLNSFKVSSFYRISKLKRGIISRLSSLYAGTPLKFREGSNGSRRIIFKKSYWPYFPMGHTIFRFASVYVDSVLDANTLDGQYDWVDEELFADQLGNIAAHELGHTFGLSHEPSDPETIMSWTGILHFATWSQRSRDELARALAR